MLFLAISLGFIVENQREHFLEHKRIRKYLGNVLLDVQSNNHDLDSLIKENGYMLSTYDSLLAHLLMKPASINRYEYAKKIFPVFMRLFKNRKETFEQMVMTGSFRYLDNHMLLNSLVGYNRLADLTEWRAMENERKIALEQSLPEIYKNFDADCLLLDIPGRKSAATHIDIISGKEAEEFCSSVSKALISRIRFIRISYSTYLMLKKESQKFIPLLEEYQR